MDWIKVEDQLPETEDWVIGMTQDGSLYPVRYKAKQWSPVFRGGMVDSLMHGKIKFWQPTPAGYPYITCENGHRYLQNAETPVCPLCKKLGLLKEAPKVVVEEPAEAEPVDEPKAEPEEKPAEVTPVAEPAEKPKAKATRKKKTAE